MFVHVSVEINESFIYLAWQQHLQDFLHYAYSFPVSKFSLAETRHIDTIVFPSFGGFEFRMAREYILSKEIHSVCSVFLNAYVVCIYWSGF